MADSESDSDSPNSVSKTQSTPSQDNSTVSTPSQDNQTQDYQIPDSQNVKNKQVLKLRDASMKVLGIVKTPTHNN